MMCYVISSSLLTLNTLFKTTAKIVMSLITDWDILIYCFMFLIFIWAVCTNVDQNLIADQRNLRAKYFQNGEEN